MDSTTPAVAEDVSLPALETEEQAQDVAVDAQDEVPTESTAPPAPEGNEETLDTGEADVSPITTFQVAVGDKITTFSASDGENIEKYLALGMQAEANAPTLEKLDRLAHAVGAESAVAFLERSLATLDQRELNDAIKRYGKEEGEKYHAFQKEQRDKAYQSSRQERESATKSARQLNNERLAAEFVELKAEYPEIATFGNLPKGVAELAVEKGIPLIDAYNRIYMKQQRLSAAAATKAADNQSSSVGSMSDRAGGGIDPTIEAMIVGVGNRI